MALAAFIAVIIVMLGLGSKGKKARQHDAFKQQSPGSLAKSASEHRRRQQEIDEQITIILPTIRNE